MRSKFLVFTSKGLEQFIKRTSKLMDKKIEAIPVIDSLDYNDKDLAVGEERVITIRKKRII